MAKKLFSVKSKITALALSVLLLIGTVPIQVSAAQTSSDVTLLNGMNKDADIKFVEFGNSDKQLAVMLVDDKGEEAYFRQLCQSIITDETSVSIPRSIKDDNSTVSRLHVVHLSSARDNLLFRPYQNGSKTPENQGFPGFYYI